MGSLYIIWGRGKYTPAFGCPCVSKRTKHVTGAMKHANLNWTVKKLGSHPKASAKQYVSMPNRKKNNFVTRIRIGSIPMTNNDNTSLHSQSVSSFQSPFRHKCTLSLVSGDPLRKPPVRLPLNSHAVRKRQVDGFLEGARHRVLLPGCLQRLAR